MDHLVSIIIPVHNTLTRNFQLCYQSVAGQTYPNLEIIIINDRSEAACLNEIRKIICGNVNVVLLDSEEAGVSCARNTGTKYSHGVYLMFMDSDDILNRNTIAEAVELLEQNNLDMVVGRYKRYAEEDIEKTAPDFGTYDSQINIIYTDNRAEAWKYFFRWDQIQCTPDGWTFHPLSSCARLLKRSICLDTSFPSGIKISEDTIWNYRLFKKPSLKIGLANCNWYVYVQHLDSVVHTIYFKNTKEVIESTRYLGREFEEMESEYYDYYVSHVFREFEFILKNYFFKNKYMWTVRKFFQFLQMCSDDPFDKIKFQRINSKKLKLKYLMFRSGMAYPWYALKDVLPIQ